MKRFALPSLIIPFGALLFAGCATKPPESPEKIAEKQAVVADLDNRPEATIPFVSSLDSFAVRRENSQDILYLTDGFGRWYRAPLTCFGMGDPQSALSIGTISRDNSINKFTRFLFLSGGGPGSRNECNINTLKELKPQETVLFGLESQKRVDAKLARQAAKEAEKIAGQNK